MDWTEFKPTFWSTSTRRAPARSTRPISPSMSRQFLSLPCIRVALKHIIMFTNAVSYEIQAGDLAILRSKQPCLTTDGSVAAFKACCVHLSVKSVEPQPTTDVGFEANSARSMQPRAWPG